MHRSEAYESLTIHFGLLSPFYDEIQVNGRQRRRDSGGSESDLGPRSCATGASSRTRIVPSFVAMVLALETDDTSFPSSLYGAFHASLMIPLTPPHESIYAKMIRLKSNHPPSYL